MIIRGKVKDCDMTGKSYETQVDGGWILARGNTGRVCVVMHVGPEYIKANDVQFNSRAAAESWALSEVGGSIDF